DGLEPQVLGDESEALPHLHRPDDVVLGRVHAERRDHFLEDRAGLAQALDADPAANLVAVRGLELLRHLRVEPLRLADLAPEVILRLAELRDLGVSNLDRKSTRLNSSHVSI